MSNAIETQGFEFAIRTAIGPDVFTPVGEIVSFTGFDGSASEIDITHLKSVAKEFMMGLQDYGNFSMDVNYLSADAGQIAMRAAKSSRAIQHFKATYSDGSFDTFQGYVMNGPKSGGVDAKMDGSFTIRISGDVTFNEAP